MIRRPRARQLPGCGTARNPRRPVVPLACWRRNSLSGARACRAVGSSGNPNPSMTSWVVSSGLANSTDIARELQSAPYGAGADVPTRMAGSCRVLARFHDTGPRSPVFFHLVTGAARATPERSFNARGIPPAVVEFQRFGWRGADRCLRRGRAGQARVWRIQSDPTNLLSVLAMCGTPSGSRHDLFRGTPAPVAGVSAFERAIPACSRCAALWRRG